MKALSFVVYGVPIPKGSTRAFVPKGWTRPIITSDNSKSKPWQEAILNAALDVLGERPPIEEPVALFVRFFMPRPKSAPRRILEPAKKPDLDKLVRCLKDGLTRAGVYRDDAQVTVVVARKEFAGGFSDPEGPAGVPRALIEVGLSTAVAVGVSWPGETIALPSETKPGVPATGSLFEGDRPICRAKPERAV